MTSLGEFAGSFIYTFHAGTCEIHQVPNGSEREVKEIQFDDLFRLILPGLLNLTEKLVYLYPQGQNWILPDQPLLL